MPIDFIIQNLHQEYFVICERPLNLNSTKHCNNRDDVQVNPKSHLSDRNPVRSTHKLSLYSAKKAVLGIRRKLKYIFQY